MNADDTTGDAVRQGTVSDTTNGEELLAERQEVGTGAPSRDAGSEAGGGHGSDASSEPVREAGDDDGEDEEGASTRSGVPERYADFLGERPTLWYESADEFDEFESAAFLEMRPKGLVNCIIVRDFVDCEWELRQMRRLQRAAMYSSLPLVASDALADQTGPIFGVVRDRSQVENCARGSAMGVPDAMKLLAERAGKKHLRPVDLHLAAYRDALPITQAISREIIRLERRRDQLLRQLDDRNAMLAASARSLIARDEAETLEATTVAA